MYQHWFGENANRFCCFAALGFCYFLDSSLDLLDVDGLAVDNDSGFQDFLDLAQFIGVACDEVYYRRGRHGVAFVLRSQVSQTKGDRKSVV